VGKECLLVETILANEAARDQAFDHEEALLLLGDVCDTILVTLDAKRSRFNSGELRYAKRALNHP